MQTAFLSVTRRFAAGIDVAARDLRIAVVSRPLHQHADVRIECLLQAPLADGVIDGVEVVDQAALSSAIAELYQPLWAHRAMRGMRCSMGLPPAATYVGTASFAELMRRIPGLSVAIEPRVALDRLEPVVRAEAERLFGVDPTSVAVDWRLSDADTVTITATPRELVDARVDAAASAGIVLTALDSDADAALRGCRLCAAVELPGENPWCAVWAGCGIVCAWLVEAQRVTREARFGVRDPGFVAHDTRAMVEALARFVDDTALAGVVVAGEPDALGAIGVTTDALGAALGCVVREFSAGGFCDAGQVDGASCTDPAFAVAFGLALRGVLE